MTPSGHPAPPGAPGEEADRALAAAARQRPGVDPPDLVAGGWDEARRRVARFVDEGITELVVGPAVAPDTWEPFLDGFVEHLVPLET